MTQALLKAPSEALLLEEQWDEELRCQSRGHKEGVKYHTLGKPASVRGTSPCGRTMNVCAEFADSMMVSMRTVDCQCGKRHFASSFTFIQI